MYLSLFFRCSEVILKITGRWFGLFQQTLVFLLTPARAGRAAGYKVYTVHLFGVKNLLNILLLFQPQDLFLFCFVLFFLPEGLEISYGRLRGLRRLLV